MKLIVGLGNPEDKYATTRHNLGFDVVDELRRKLNAGIWEHSLKFKAEIIKTSYVAKDKKYDVILLRPQTYMNNSGQAVGKAANFYKIKPKDIVIVHDELDLMLGKIKVRDGGGTGGHHGVESIAQALGSNDFSRVRCGIGNNEGFLSEHNRASFSADKFVMEAFQPQEHSKVKTMIKRAIKALDILLEQGVEKAQNQFN